MTSEKKEFHLNENFAKACAKAKEGNGRLHFLGLVRSFILMHSFCCLQEHV